MTLEGSRMLNKNIPYSFITTDNDNIVRANSIFNGWEIVSAGAFHDDTWVYRTYFDMSGYNRKDLTQFYAGVEIQEEMNIYGTLQGHLVTILSTEYITDEAILDGHTHLATAFGDLPGFPASIYNQEQIVMGTCETFFTSTVWNLVASQGMKAWGTCSASTADKLHITRIYYPMLGLPQTMKLPPCNIVLGANMVEEKELAYLMRQKRSYELATGPD